MHGFFHIVRPTTNTMPAKNAGKSPPMKPNQLKADELPDDLRWDFLRELVEEEFAKLEPMIANEQMAQQKHHAQTLSLACQNLQNLDVLSAASTANNSPAGRPIQPSTEAPPLVGEKGGEPPLQPKLREPTVIMHRVRYPSAVMSSHCSEYMITLPGHEMQALL